jgi:hypothetical protein
MRFVTRFMLPAILGLSVLPAVAIEQPRYTVVGSEGDLEIRRYDPYLVAETFGSREFGEAGNEGFRRLFRYIAGSNTQRAEISMTAPVAQQRQVPSKGTEIAMTAPVSQVNAGDGHWVSFVVPSSFTIDTVPQPSDPAVRIRQVPAQLVAVIRYSGFWSERRYQREERRLREAMSTAGLVPAGEAQFARYDPPYMPPFMRRNEILIPVAGDVSASSTWRARPLARLALN